MHSEEVQIALIMYSHSENSTSSFLQSKVRSTYHTMNLEFKIDERYV